ncbi:MAG: hypothetical protein AAGF20_09855 [Pseudomonadota bacterium]
MAKSKIRTPWFYRVRGTKFMPASLLGWIVLAACMAAMVSGVSAAGLKLLQGELMGAAISTGAAMVGLAFLGWATQTRTVKHPQSRWID